MTLDPARGATSVEPRRQGGASTDGPVSPGADLDSLEPTATGLKPRTAAVLAYLAWWLTGALFVVLEPAHPFVRFHARQALVVFGLISVAGVGLWLASLVSMFASPVLFRVMAVLAPALWIVGVVLWVICVIQAARGRRWPVPWLGRLATRQ